MKAQQIQEALQTLTIKLFGDYFTIENEINAYGKFDLQGNCIESNIEFKPFAVTYALNLVTTQQ